MTDSRQSVGDFIFRTAVADDLPAIARIHKLAYSRNHFTALLPENVLTQYYSYFLSQGTEILLAISRDNGSVVQDDNLNGAIGFAVFGTDIPAKIAIFKARQRTDIIKAAILNPLLSTRKLIDAIISRLQINQGSQETDYLLLSIATYQKGSGVGRNLLRRMIQTARQNNHQKVGLFVNYDNTSAINAYYAEGFVIRSRSNKQYYMEKIIDSEI